MKDKNLLILIEEHSNMPIAKALNVNPIDYSGVLLAGLEFSQRASNVLRRNGFITLCDLLEISFARIWRLKNLGQKTLVEIIEKCEEECSKQQSKSAILKRIISYVSAELVKYTDSCSDEQELARIVEGILQNFPQGYSMRPDITRQLAKLEVFYDSGDYYKFVGEGINSQLRRMEAGPFISAFSFIYGEEAVPGLLNFRGTIEELIDRFKNGDYDCNNEYYGKFFKWLNNDWDYLRERIFSFDDRTRTVLVMLAEGLTLQVVGKKLGITRERVRQIQEKAYIKIARGLSRYNVLPWIYALSGGHAFLYESDFQRVISDANIRNVILHGIKGGRFDKENKWKYLKDYDAFFFAFASKCNQEEISEIVSTFPDDIRNDQMDEMILSATELHGCDLSILLKEINKQYIKYLEFYSRKNYTFSNMCSYVLKTRFPNGYKISDEEQFKEFCEYLKQLFNYNPGNLSEHNLTARLAECSFFCDKGVYKHISYLSVKEETKKLIENFIKYQFDEVGRTALLFKEIYINLVKEVPDLEIENEYVLHSVISEMSLPYLTSRAYLLCEKDANFDNDFVAYVKSHYPVHVSKAMDYFCISDQQVYQVIGRCKNVVVKGRILLFKH